MIHTMQNKYMIRSQILRQRNFVQFYCIYVWILKLQKYQGFLKNYERSKVEKV